VLGRTALLLGFMPIIGVGLSFVFC
jgi:hypothetical protein